MKARTKMYLEVEGPIMVGLNTVTAKESNMRISTMMYAKAKLAVFCSRRLPWKTFDAHWVGRMMLGRNKQPKCRSQRRGGRQGCRRLSDHLSACREFHGDDVSSRDEYAKS
jgi:hypothetical protein